MTRTLLLDLDGTLVNSVPDLRAALNRVMAAHGATGFTEAETALMVGDGVAALVQRAFAARGLTADAEAIAAYASDYAQHATEATHPYPGVVEALRSLGEEGWRFAVCTNKPEATARALLAGLGLGPFAAVGGGDSFPVRKPDPAHLRATLEAAGGVPEQAVMVGDHANDVAAANGAGVPCIFAAWGYGPPAMAEGAAAIARDVTEMVAIARRLLTPCRG